MITVNVTYTSYYAQHRTREIWVWLILPQLDGEKKKKSQVR